MELTRWIGVVLATPALDASALDILALFGTGTTSGGGTYTARVKSGLTLKARKRSGRVTFTSRTPAILCAARGWGRPGARPARTDMVASRSRGTARATA